jgi:hypothetical protein
MRIASKLIPLCLLFVLALGLAAGDAAAKRKAVDSQITLTSVSQDGAGGIVSGKRQACVAERRVTLYQLNSGPSVPSAFPVARTNTRADGSWSFGGWLYSGQYFAKVQGLRTGHIHCLLAVSEGLVF